jgi:hypothetical protein
MLVVLVGILLTSATYAAGLGELLPAGFPAARRLPEYAVLTLLGVTMLVVARQARHHRVYANLRPARGFTRTLVSASAAAK